MRTPAASLVVLAAAASIAAAQPSALRGAVTIDGSSTVFPITEAAAAAFRKEFPNVNVTVGVSGTGGGFKRFVKGETDISDASRPIKPQEFALAKENGVQFIEIPVALDGLSVVVSPSNTWTTSLTVEDLQAIYLEDGGARKWSDINPEWPSETIKVYSPGTDSGTFDYFQEVMLPEGKSFRADMSTSEDDNVLVTGVTGDEHAIGYFGASYYFENQDKLRAVPIVNPDTGQAVLPEPQHVIDGTYAPLSRPLFIYVNVESLRRPQVREFVEFFLGHDGEFAEQVEYVALPDEVDALAEEFLRSRVAGSVFVTPAGDKREGRLRELYARENVVNTR